MPSVPQLSSASGNSVRRVQAGPLAMLWPRLIELWIAGVVLAFFLVRVLGSQTGQRVLSHFHKSPLQ
jgi:hypothetical protein